VSSGHGDYDYLGAYSDGEWPSKAAVGGLAGWSIHPIGSDAKPEEAPCGVLAGIVIFRWRRTSSEAVRSRASRTSAHPLSLV